MICLDTMVLIWGVRKEASGQQQHMVRKTHLFLNALQEERESILIPTPALSEFLIGVKQEKWSRYLEIFQESFRIMPFDYPAAQVAARITQKALSSDVSKAFDIKKEALKFDAAIIAIAKLAGAEYLITEDPHFKKITIPGMKIMGVPEVKIQEDMVSPGQKKYFWK